ncbi:retrovirus-related pol polyprotein from transposon TNT 1-94 [Tanacetum coccineum]
MKLPRPIHLMRKNIQVLLNATVCNVPTDNGTEFVNQTLHDFYENVSISHQTSVARTPQQNDVVERRNQTLIEVARTMLIFSKAPLFLWAEAINTACYTQNRSLICPRYNKTPYELMQDKKSDLSFFHVFGALCYPTNDNDDLGKLDAKADISIFVGYAPVKKAFRIYNKRTHKVIETIHVTFDELTTMAFEQFSSGSGLHSMTPATSSLRLVPNTISQQPCIPPKRDDCDNLFQPMFDEYFNPSSIVVSPIQKALALRVMVLADSPVSTSIDQDALSTSIPSIQEKEHSPNISQGFEESPKTPTFRDDLLYESLHEDSSLTDPSSNVTNPYSIENPWQEESIDFENICNRCKNRGYPYLCSKYRQQEYDDLSDGRQPSRCVQLKKLSTSQISTPVWYDMLSSFLISQHFSKGVVDPTLFTGKAGNDLLLDYKFHKVPEASLLTNLNMLMKLLRNMVCYMVEKNNLDEDIQGTPVDATLYRGMIGSLMYLTSSRPDLIYAVCLCARYQAKLTEKHLQAVKRIFRYLKGTINMGL